MKASPNRRNGKFVNSLPTEHPSFFKALSVVHRAAADFGIAPASGLRITWLGHSTFLVEIDGGRVLVDPVLSPRPSPFTWAGPKQFHARGSRCMLTSLVKRLSAEDELLVGQEVGKLCHFVHDTVTAAGVLRSSLRRSAPEPVDRTTSQNRRLLL